MSESSGSGSTGILGVLVGAIIVAGLGWFFLAGGVAHGDKVNVEIKAPSVSAPAPAK